VKTTFTHIPDEDLDCGALGPQSARFTAVIDAEENRFGWSYTCVIVKVVIDLRLGANYHMLTLDVTPAFTQDKFKREDWETQILRAYQSAHMQTPDDNYDSSHDREGA
jgi:hypothetical protein